MSLAVSDPVQVINYRLESYTRRGIITSLTGNGRKTRKVNVRFTDLPDLSQQEQRDQTGFTRTFVPEDLARVEDE